MANTFSDIYLHIVFSVKDRANVIPLEALPVVHAVMGKYLRQQNHIPIAIGGTFNHVHILIRYCITQPIPDMVRELKKLTTKFIMLNRITGCRFAWQRGYGCFSYSSSQIGDVAQYIRNQLSHHANQSLQNEYENILRNRGIQFEAKYLLDDCGM